MQRTESTIMFTNLLLILTTIPIYIVHVPCLQRFTRKIGKAVEKHGKAGYEAMNSQEVVYCAIIRFKMLSSPRLMLLAGHFFAVGYLLTCEYYSDKSKWEGLISVGCFYSSRCQSFSKDHCKH